MAYMTGVLNLPLPPYQWTALEIKILTLFFQQTAIYTALSSDQNPSGFCEAKQPGDMPKRFIKVKYKKRHATYDKPNM